MAQIEILSGIVVTLKTDQKQIVLVPIFTRDATNYVDYDPVERTIMSWPGTLPLSEIDWAVELRRLTREEFVTAWVALEMGDDPEEVKAQDNYQTYVDRARKRAGSMYDTPGMFFEAV
ncbi:MAG: hypothetical protein Q8L37_03385 [Candidatus Gottesmanbacteria bacterium]|nr:hypothetical protein [Candidatus Gottesmanbacteria bacterium]